MHLSHQLDQLCSILMNWIFLLFIFSENRVMAVSVNLHFDFSPHSSVREGQFLSLLCSVLF